MDTAPEHSRRQPVNRQLSDSADLRRMGDGMVGVVRASTAGMVASCSRRAVPAVHDLEHHWRRTILCTRPASSCRRFPHDRFGCWLLFFSLLLCIVIQGIPRQGLEGWLVLPAIVLRANALDDDP